MKILIGYDGSKESDRALAGLALAGLPGDTEALVATVTNPWPDVGPETWAGASFGLPADDLTEHALEEAHDLADKAVRRLGKLFPSWRILGEAIRGRPAQGLIDKADAWKPDLVALGSRGRGGFSKLALGSVSLRVLHHAKTGVRISRFRPGRAKGAPVRIILGMDGSAGADRALAELESRHWPQGAWVRVVSVVDWRDAPAGLLKPAQAGLPERTRDAVRTWIEAKAEEVARDLVRKGFKAGHEIILGDPRHSLLKAAKAWKADAVFLGSRGLNAVDRFLLGSVSSAVAAHAPCSVEVVRGLRGRKTG